MVFSRAVGADVSWTLFAVAIPITLLATLTPFSLNGVGLREGVLVGLLAHAGVSSGHAGALSILIDLQMVPFALLGAVFWMRCRRVALLRSRPSDVTVSCGSSSQPWHASNTTIIAIKLSAAPRQEVRPHHILDEREITCLLTVAEH